jgi:hypothetical protein
MNMMVKHCVSTAQYLVYVDLILLGMPVRRELQFPPDWHTKQSLIIPDDVLIQFDLLMMSAVTLETCRDIKQKKYTKKCVKLVISKNL